MYDTTLHLRTIVVAGKDPKRSEEIAGILTEELAGVTAVPEALKDMEADAVKSTGQRNFPKAKDNGILYLTDSPAFHERPVPALPMIPPRPVLFPGRCTF